jgi:hypothetical protein
MGSFINNKDTRPTLDEIELKFLIQFIASSTFRGENLKILYNIVEKLEKQLHG